MCYPCRQCGKCKNTFSAYECPMCNAPLEKELFEYDACPNCGFSMPAPPGYQPGADKSGCAGEKVSTEM